MEGLTADGLLGTSTAVGGPRSLLIDDVGLNLIFGLRSATTTAPRSLSIYRLDLRSATAAPQLVYDAIQRGADVALCPTQGIRYSLSQDGAELILPENTALSGGGCSAAANVRGRLLAITLAGPAASAAPVLQLDGVRVAEVNWTATWSHEEVAALTFQAPDAATTRNLRYLTRPGRQASLLRAWPAVPVPATLFLFNLDNRWMHGQLQIVPGGSLSSVGVITGDAFSPIGWYRASFSLSGAGSLTREADASVPGAPALVDSVLANRGMTRTGTAVGEDGRVGAPLPGFGRYQPAPFNGVGDIRASLCQSYDARMLYPLATGQISPAAGVDVTAAVRPFCTGSNLTPLGEGVRAVRGDSLVLLSHGGLLHLYDLQTQALLTGRVSASDALHALSSDGRWLVTRRVESGQLRFDLHDTRAWNSVPRR